MSTVYTLIREVYNEDTEEYYELEYELDIDYVVHRGAPETYNPPQPAEPSSIEITGVTYKNKMFLLTDEEMADIEWYLIQEESL